MNTLILAASVLGAAAVVAMSAEVFTFAAWRHERRLRYAAERRCHVAAKLAERVNRGKA